MLLLTETIDAIRAIDTEEAILLRACHAVLYPDVGKAPEGDWPAPRLAQEFILLVDSKGSDTTIALEALTIGLGTTAAASVKFGHELEFFLGVTQSLRKIYISVLVERLRETHKGNPEKLYEALIAIVEQTKSSET